MPLQGHVDLVSVSEVKGWAFDRDQPRTALDISIVVDGVEVGRCKTDIEREGLKEALGEGASGIHEFRYSFDPPLDNRDHHHIEILATQNSVPLGNGRVTLYRTSNGNPRFTPILLASNGRSGTTMLMQEFATHPDIAVANAYPFEFKLTSYYAAAWNILSQTTHMPTESEIDFAAHSTRDFVIGRNPWNRPDLLGSCGGTHATRLISRVFPDRLARFFSSMVEETYESISSTQGKSAHFFAEKSPLQEPVRQACRTLFSNVKEIVLVRDPRDYLCSATKFWAHDVGEVMATQATELPVIMKIFNDRRNDVLFVRYEDVVLDAVSARKRIYDFIGCDATFQPHQVDPDVIPEAHRTSASPADSVGRFRTELDERTLRACQDSFGGFMKMFDYKY